MRALRRAAPHAALAVIVLLHIQQACAEPSPHHSTRRHRPTIDDMFWRCAFPRGLPEGTANAAQPQEADRLQAANASSLLPSTWNGCMKYACASPADCTRTLHAMAESVMHILNCSNSAWLPVYGTLLGLVRNQSLSPNDVDMDVDFAVGEPWFNYFSRPSSNFVRALAMLGYHVAGTEPHILRICVAHGFPGLERDTVRRRGQYHDNYKFIDLFSMRPHIDSARHAAKFKIHLQLFEPSDLFPLQAMQYKGKAVPIPARPDRVLSRLYGEWRVVRRTKHGYWGYRPVKKSQSKV